MTTKVTDADLKETARIFLANDCKIRPTAKAMGMSRHGVRLRLKKAQAAGLIPPQDRHPKFDILLPNCPNRVKLLDT